MSNSKQPFGGILSGLLTPGKNITKNVQNSSRQALEQAGQVTTQVQTQAAQMSLLAILSYIAVVLIIVLIFLIFIDRFITPVFKLKPGAPGYIPLPYGDDGILYWKKTPNVLRDDSTIIANLSNGYTLSLDIFIHNPMAFAKTPRLLFWRGTNILQLQKTTQGQTQSPQFGITEFNLLFSLSNDTNDLTVATMLDKDNTTSQQQLEHVKMNNVPIRKGFRVTVVMFNKLMEVYLNGKLYQSRPLLFPPKPSFHYINPPTPEGEATAAVRNLKIWNRCLSSAEVREIMPPVDDFSDFGNVQPGCGNVSELATALISKL
jgi:uncharacterized membrane protein (DUF106 family)